MAVQTCRCKDSGANGMEKCPSVSQWAGEWAVLQKADDQAVFPRLEGNLHSKMAQPSLYSHILIPQRDRSQTDTTVATIFQHLS